MPPLDTCQTMTSSTPLLIACPCNLMFSSPLKASTMQKKLNKIKWLMTSLVKPRSMAGAIFLKFLSENESAFDLLYCITFKLMDNQWLAMHASYMDFNKNLFFHMLPSFSLQTVMKSTRRQLERELLLEDVSRLEDLPSYSLLTR
ncbi:hypothetical protein CK203_034184 [Vitis vinifera]|uniref:ELMO domain-containing protein n=1 Tax=Vitis vinifera TaxID=29760 RepID=A0A438IFR5_VITVI|nr:hypothetical protein CK203_034184 [Vitis vinifera]